MSTSINHEQFMREAIRLSAYSIHNNGGPFGAVIVQNGVIVGRGHNCVTAHNDPTAHAEIQAIRNACSNLKNFHLNDCVIYTSCEPCPMCLSAIYWARINTIYYAASREDAAKINFIDAFIYDEINLPPEKRSIPFIPLLRNEAVAVHQQWTNLSSKIPY